MSEVDRRGFLRGCILAGPASWVLQGQPPNRYLIEAIPDASLHRKLAERELLRGMTRLHLPGEIALTGPDSQPLPGGLKFQFRTEPAGFQSPDQYAISWDGERITFLAGSDRALLYAVFDFLEHQGAFFGIDGESYPLEGTGRLALPPAGVRWPGTPRFAVRGLLPWPDFLNCISVYNDEDFRAYFESMLRMRFNMFGMHVYSSGSQWAESYLSFDFAGASHLAYLDNSASNRWGYLPQRTSTYAMGGAQFYDSEVFGSDATRLARDPWETAERTRKLLRDALSYAKELGIAVGIGFEPYQIPEETLRALPPEARLPKQPAKENVFGARLNVETTIARRLLEVRLAQLLEAYPEVDYVWLWEDEGMNWESRNTGIPLSPTPFLQAHDFLRRHAPKKRLVLSGWGGVARHFEGFHRQLPGDVVFSCLSDSLGWDPVHEVFGKLEGRERWPIPWLEDDPSMWLPQFHVNRFERDMNLAASYGCQGLIGIHWRHRIVDPTAGFQARFSWDRELKPADYYRAFARTQAAGDRAGKLASTLQDADLNRKLLCTGTDEMKDGHIVQHEFSGDYDEAFTFWKDYEPSSAVLQTQKDVAETLRRIAGDARTPVEKERLEYLVKHIEFLIPYSSAWLLAHRMHGLLADAAKAKAAGKAEEAASKVREEVVPLWLKLAPEVRRAVLDFQSIIATRNDLGTLASMQNKFVRLALIRLRLSMLEYLGELPPETEKLFAEITQPDISAPARLIVPTRPSMLAAEDSVRIMILATGNQPVDSVVLHTRLRDAREWSAATARLKGRRTYEAFLGGFGAGASLAEYYVTAKVGAMTLVAPLNAPANSYLVTLI